MLCRITACKPLTSRIPSRQVINYYECLLKGIPVEPDLGNANYALVLNKRRARDGKVPNVLPIADEENVVPDLDNDGILSAVRHPPQPKPKPAPISSVRASRARRAKAPGPVQPPPPLENGPPPVCGGGDEPPAGGDVPPGGGGGEDSDDGIVGGAASSSAMPATQRQVKPKPLAYAADGLIDGTVLTWTDYVTPLGKPYPNFHMTCKHCTVTACSGRTRGGIVKLSHRFWVKLSLLHFYMNGIKYSRRPANHTAE